MPRSAARRWYGAGDGAAHNRCRSRARVYIDSMKAMLPFVVGCVVCALTIAALTGYFRTPPDKPGAGSAVSGSTRDSPSGVARGDQRGVADLPSPADASTPIRTATFTGTLERVDTGCFADGECYVIVDRRHVTAITGWNGSTVGRVIGVEGFGDLELKLGQQVQVFARQLDDGRFTLYGDEGYFIKVL
jgi:hypothetical protein